MFWADGVKGRGIKKISCSSCKDFPHMLFMQHCGTFTAAIIQQTDLGDSAIRK